MIIIFWGQIAFKAEKQRFLSLLLASKTSKSTKIISFRGFGSTIIVSATKLYSTFFAGPKKVAKKDPHIWKYISPHLPQACPAKNVLFNRKQPIFYQKKDIFKGLPPSTPRYIRTKCGPPSLLEVKHIPNLSWSNPLQDISRRPYHRYLWPDRRGQPNGNLSSKEKTSTLCRGFN